MTTTGILLLGQFIYAILVFRIEWSKIISSQYNIFSFILNNLDSLLIPILFISFVYFLKKRKKWAWFAAIVLLLKETIGGIHSLFLYLPNLPSLITQWEQEMIPLPLYSFITLQIISIIVFIFVLLSLIFLILDRKKYWQISS